MQKRLYALLCSQSFTLVPKPILGFGPKSALKIEIPISYINYGRKATIKDIAAR